MFIEIINNIIEYIEENNLYYSFKGIILFKFFDEVNKGFINLDENTKTIKIIYRKCNKDNLEEEIYPFINKCSKIV